MRNIDTSGMTEEQIKGMHEMQAYLATRGAQHCQNVISLAERYSAALLESDSSRPSPVALFPLAVKYAEHFHHAGEQFMAEDFAKWRAAQPTETVEQEEVSDLDDEDLHVGSEHVVDDSNTITRDDAVADTERRAKDLAGPSATVEHFETDKGTVVVARTADTAVGGLVE